MGIIIDKAKLLWSKTNRFHRVLIIFLTIELKIIPGGQLGFRCKDPALSYPFNGDTVSWKSLIAVSTLLPLAMMLVMERKYHNMDNERPKKRALRWFREYMFGFLINLTIVQGLKLIVGSPRPHFFDTCMPKEGSTCTDSEYVSSYTCTKTVWLNQSDRSFPSGHSSLAIYAGVFIAYYLHRRCNAQKRAIQSIQAASIVAAVFCAISRMTDHRHHWWDVLAGTIIALIALLYTTHTLCKNFECSSTKSIDKDNTKSIDKEQANDTNKIQGGSDGPSIPILETIDTQPNIFLAKEH